VAPWDAQRPHLAEALQAEHRADLEQEQRR
jgi:hypothetical protein